MNGHIDPVMARRAPAPSEMSMERAQRMWNHAGDRLVHHALGVAGGSLLGLVTSVGGMLAMIGEQVVYDDSSGASGSQPPMALAWFLLALAGLSLLAAVAASVGSIVGLLRRRHGRRERSIWYHVGALTLAAPGTTVVAVAIVASIIVGFS